MVCKVWVGEWLQNWRKAILEELLGLPAQMTDWLHQNSATFAALQAKHPSSHCDTVIPPPPPPPHLSHTLQVETGAVIRAIRSFPRGSAGVPDCLRPQYLKDILQVDGDESSIFSQPLASFCALVLERRVWPFLFGTSLVALEKKSGGVRPITVGCTLRRLVAKIAGQMVGCWLDGCGRTSQSQITGLWGQRWGGGCCSCD